MSATDLEQSREQEGPERRGGAGHGNVGVVGKPVTRGEIAGELEMDPGVVEGKPSEVEAPHDEAPALEEEGVGRDEGGRGEQERPATPHRLSRTNV